jgi:hypothetical protein
MTCDFLFKTGSGLLAFGRGGRAREQLVEGRDLAEEHQLNAWYFRFDRALTELETSVAREPEPATRKAGLSELPAIREVAVGLRDTPSKQLVVATDSRTGSRDLGRSGRIDPIAGGGDGGEGEAGDREPLRSAAGHGIPPRADGEPQGPVKSRRRVLGP